ncbi:MAG: hypothetical protein QOJ09_90 [Actinomycetota bacterium]|jgi:hypothetical protein|nr:hypothetical protein [Actinomycetota bacterium]
MRKLAMTLFVFAVTLAACGGSDNPATNAAGSKSTTTKAGVSASASASASAKFCGLSDKYSGLQTTSPNLDAAALRKQMETAKTALQEAVSAAPSEIKADLRIVADAYVPFIDALAKANFDFTKVNPQDAAFAKMQDPSVAAAATRIGDWAKAHCGA